MAIDFPGGMGPAGFFGQTDLNDSVRQNVRQNNPQDASAQQRGNGSPQPMSGQGAQFVYVAATVANILCTNLTQIQINLLANFLSVITACVYAILTVENPTDVLET